VLRQLACCPPPPLPPPLLFLLLPLGRPPETQEFPLFLARLEEISVTLMRGGIGGICTPPKRLGKKSGLQSPSIVICRGGDAHYPSSEGSNYSLNTPNSNITHPTGHT